MIEMQGFTTFCLHFQQTSPLNNMQQACFWVVYNRTLVYSEIDSTRTAADHEYSRDS